VKVVEGWARFRDGKTVEVETEIGPQVIRAEQVVIATFALSRWLFRQEAETLRRHIKRGIKFR
jgi:pyruvate/2-oxoglutarate dehydrogenase complex dihydrolipoamide dehydrogenase (E3) component